MPGVVLTATRGDVAVVRTLYGTVSPERREREQRDVEHRANMLYIPARAQRRERTFDDDQVNDV